MRRRSNNQVAVGLHVDLLSEMNFLAGIICSIILPYMTHGMVENPQDGICLAEDSEALQVR